MQASFDVEQQQGKTEREDGKIFRKLDMDGSNHSNVSPMKDSRFSELMNDKQ